MASSKWLVSLLNMHSREIPPQEAICEILHGITFTVCPFYVLHFSFHASFPERHLVIPTIWTLLARRSEELADAFKSLLGSLQDAKGSLEERLKGLASRPYVRPTDCFLTHPITVIKIRRYYDDKIR